jgi:hypothetical protein
VTARGEHHRHRSFRLGGSTPCFEPLRFGAGLGQHPATLDHEPRGEVSDAHKNALPECRIGAPGQTKLQPANTASLEEGHRRIVLRPAVWLAGIALVVLTTRTLVYALAPQPTLTAGPLVLLALVGLGAAATAWIIIILLGRSIT